MKILKYSTLTVISLIILLIAGMYFYVRSTLPDYNGEYEISGIDGKIEILRDENAVPHIFAGTQYDLAFGLGYVMAQDRLFQMDLFRRVALGRLSELFGELTLEADKYAKILGFERSAVEHLGSISQEEKKYFESFIRGINQYITSEKDQLPIEFRIFGYSPELFATVDIIALSVFQAYSSNFNWKFEILRAAAKSELGSKIGRELVPSLTFHGPYMALPGYHHKDEGKPQNREETEALGYRLNPVNSDLLAALQKADTIFKFFTGFYGGQVHSNFWIVSGKISKTGKPILANDYHMPFLLPSIWYEVHLQGDGIDAMGITLPGYPTIIAGHNRHIAWGATTTGADTQDIFIEKLNPENRDEYVYKGKYYPFKKHTERIYYKKDGDRKFIDITIKTSRHGPIINSLIQNLPDDYPPLALQQVEEATKGQTTFCMQILKAENWQEFKETISHFNTPIWNWGYADIHANIGLKVNGLIPIRKRGKGLEPIPGWTGEYEWNGTIPFDELPEVYNPPKGYIVSANNEIFDSRYPYSIIGSAFVLPYRAMRIEELIGRNHSLSYDTMRDIQSDTHSMFGLKLARYISDATKNSAIENERIEKLITRVRKWDGSTGTDSIGCTIIHEFFGKLAEKVFQNKMSMELYKQFQAFGNLNYVASVLLLMLEDDSLQHWFDDPKTQEIETRNETILKSLLDTDRTLSEYFGKKISNWKWGKIHTITFKHRMGMVPPFKWLWNIGPFEFPGDMSTVNPGFHTDLAKKPYEVTNGASMRHVIDFGDFSNARLVITTGQSERWLSPFYDDQSELWRKIKYIPMQMDEQEIKADTIGILIFNPKQPTH